MKKSIILMFICAIALMFSSCSRNSGTSHLTQEEKLMKTHIMTYFKQHVKSYNTIVIKYAEPTQELFYKTLSDASKSFPTHSDYIVTVAYAYGKKGYEDVESMILSYTYFDGTEPKLFLYDLEKKYYWILKEGVMDWKTLWMEDK